MPYSVMENQIEQLQQWIDESPNTVFFGGAGVSTESGIPDFRSVDGLYNQKYSYPPEMMISHTFYERYPEEFFRFYRDKMVHPDAKPNAAHLKLAELEHAGKLQAVLTQNIDGLHQAAGSRNVLELHGSTKRNYCEKCGAPYTEQEVMEAEDVPRCKHCGGRIKPDVVLYEEPLDEEVMTGALYSIRRAKLLIVGGTSLVVYPAAGLVDAFQGDHIVLINRDPTPQDSKADLIIRGSIGEVMSQLKA